MPPQRLRRAALTVMFVSLGAVTPLAGMAARGTVAGPKATARENVPVRGGMGADSRVVGELQQGELVTIDIELNGHAGRWCGVIQQGKTTPMGYVPCGSLERQARTGRNWRHVGTKTLAQPEPPTDKVAQPVSEKRPYADVKVLLYVTSWCPQCARARALLRSLGVSVAEYDIEREPAREAEMAAKSGQTGIPVIDIEGTVLVGFSESRIREMVEKRRAS